MGDEKTRLFRRYASTGKTLRLNVLRYTDEIVQAQSLGLESFELSEKEVSIGSELINKLTVKFPAGKICQRAPEKADGR